MEEEGRMNERAEQLLELLNERIVVMDGATGTALQARHLTAEDFGGEQYEGCNEHLVLTRPDVVASVHRDYLEAGALLVETDTFGGTPLVLGEYGLAERAAELNREAARIAREACSRHSTSDKPRFVVGSMGPTTKAITVTGGATFREMEGHYRIQALGLLEGGADLLALETVQDTRNVKAGLLGVRQAMEETGITVPLLLSATIEASGTMLAGQTIEAFYASVMHAPLLAVGLNCATGPDLMRSHLRSLASLAKARVSCYPNAGLPDENGRYPLTPEDFARAMERFAREGWVNLVGGCCGTTPAHIRALAQAVEGIRPRRVPDHSRCFLSGVDFLEVETENRPVLVGERTNVLGSREFKRRIAAGDHDGAAEVAREQVKAGGQVLDVCLQDPDRDEGADVEAFLERAIRAVRVPLMIDSTDVSVVERALTWCQGKAVINSVNLEDGETRMAAVAELARSYGAAVVVGTIDEDPKSGMALTKERKLAIALRAFGLLTEKYGLPPEDLIFDPLVFPCGTGDGKYAGSAVQTLQGLSAIKAALPDSKTILGISNVSFGLPEGGREVLNAVFLYHATLAGLDMAIVNTARLRRYPSLTERERALAEDLLFDRGPDPLGAFTAYFRGAGRPEPTRALPEGTPAERTSRRIVEGTKLGLLEDLEALLAEGLSPLEVINGPLMAGMEEVGRLFAANQLIVAEVLQSAEVMKAAVEHLQAKMPRGEGAAKAIVLLATVKGDVHDIGKNLVDIVFSNNGYRVVNLGIKVPSEALVRAAREHGPQAIGLSGLLVKSAHQMVTTAQDLAAAGVDAPLLVGGAALTEKFTRSRIAPAYGGAVVYAKDAMAGLALLGRVLDPAQAARLRDETRALAREGEAAAAEPLLDALDPPPVRSARVDLVPPLPPPDREERVLEPSLEEVWPFVNPQMLFGKHLGLKGSFAKLLQEGDPKARELNDRVKDLRGSGWIRPRALYRFFDAESEGNAVRIWMEGRAAETFVFPRQGSGERECIADYVRPASEGGGDSVALFVTTAGEGVRGRAEELKREGRYLLCHMLQALALETAEAAAEWVHAKLRAQWGFPDPPEMTMLERFQARYRGKRFSFGYPACPDLSLQEPLFALLRPERIGVTLTEGHMMDPEASVSALVVHHPQARYFGA
jgi:5-methyltetrahydrofolate--homocysteine methyltransferase